MNVVAWPVLLPLVAGAVLLLLRTPRQRALFAAAAATLTLLIDGFIAWRTLSGEVLVVQMAAWPAPYGITLVADGLTGLLLLLGGVTGLLTVLFASSSLQTSPRRGQSARLNRAREVFGTHALLQFLFMGVNMSFLTGDLFNLFVAFEVMLIASYGLLLLGGEVAQLREGFKYVVINLIASAIFVVTAGLAYGLFGTLNLADIAVRLRDVVNVQGPDPRVTMVALLLGLVFATKAALFPLGFWLPNAYPAPPAATSAFFAAMLTKVGIYALLRTFTLMFPQETGALSGLLLLAGFTVLLGGFGAIARQRWRHLLAFANISSIGYLAMGAFLGTLGGLAAGVYYLINSVLVVFTLFLIAGLAEKIAGEDYRSEGHLRDYPWLGVGYFIAALTLAGLPPTSGFIGKFALIGALFARGDALAVLVGVAAVVTGGLLLYATVLVWRSFFWGDADAVHSVSLPRGMVLPTAASVALLVALAAASGPVYAASERVAAQLLTNAQYISEVLPDVAQVVSQDAIQPEAVQQEPVQEVAQDAQDAGGE